MTRGLLGLFLISATLNLGYGSVFALLAEFRTAFGFEAWALGVIGSSGFAAGFAAQVGLARFADRGHERALLAGGVLAGAIGMLALVFATELWHFVGARLLSGLGSGAFAPALRRRLVTRDPERAGEALGRMAVFELGGFLLGPVWASILSERFGLKSPFLLLSVLLFLLAPTALRRREATVPSSHAGGGIRALLRLPAVRASLLAGTAFYLTIGIFEATWAILLADRGASQLFIGATLSLFGLPMLFIPPFGGRLAQRRGPLTVMAGSLGTAAVCMSLYGLFEPLWLLAITVAVHSVADAFTMPASQLAIARASPPEHIATGQGLLGALGLAVAALAAALGGLAYGTLGPFLLYAGAGLAMALLLGAALTLGAALRGPEARR